MTWEAELKPNRIYKFTIFDNPYILVKDDVTGRHVVIDAVFPPRSVPLYEGLVFTIVLEGGQKYTAIECRYHRWYFGCNGKCLNTHIKVDERTKMANIKGVYKSDVLKFGRNELIFAWLGDQSCISSL